jgi:hypothetical protein
LQRGFKTPEFATLKKMFSWMDYPRRAQQTLRLKQNEEL